MLRQIEWSVQNEPTKKNTVLQVTTLFFKKFSSSLRTSYKESIWCTNNSNVHIRTLRKRWSFIRRCFFSVSVLNKIFSKCKQIRSFWWICSHSLKKSLNGNLHIFSVKGGSLLKREFNSGWFSGFFREFLQISTRGSFWNVHLRDVFKNPVKQLWQRFIVN